MRGLFCTFKIGLYLVLEPENQAGFIPKSQTDNSLLTISNQLNSCGGPQGLVLGPLSMLPLERITQTRKISFFFFNADDTQIYIP